MPGAKNTKKKAIIVPSFLVVQQTNKHPTLFLFPSERYNSSFSPSIQDDGIKATQPSPAAAEYQKQKLPSSSSRTSAHVTDFYSSTREYLFLPSEVCHANRLSRWLE
jgi:hypothetical protein